MRHALLAVGVLLTPAAFGQTSGNLFTTTRPDAGIVVRKHAAGSDVVEITMQQPQYPVELLRSQVAKLGQLLGSEPTALQIGPYQVGADSRLTFTRAFFGINGLIDRANGVLHVEPLAKAFAGAPKPNTVDVLMIQFEGEKPGENTLRVYEPKTGEVRVQGMSAANALGVEYRVQLLTQDPDKISIPDDRRTPPRQIVTAPAPKSGPDWVLYAVIVVAALAVGALVYSLLLRARPGARRP